MRTINETEKANILVIDDDSLLTKSLKKLLTKAGYFVDTAKDGYEGIEKAKSGYFHLVLCDIRMPGLDGLMTIRHIQDFQEKAGEGKSGFIVITAFDAPETRQHAFQLGVSDFVTKPFDAEKFLLLVSRHIMRHAGGSFQQEIMEYNERLERLIETATHQHPEAAPKEKSKKKSKEKL